MPPTKHFVHPRSREAEYTFARKNRDERVREQSLAHRANKRQPVLGLFKYFQTICLLNKDKHEYKEKELEAYTKQYILDSHDTLLNLKQNIANQSKQIAFKTQVQFFNQGQFQIPDLTDRFVTVALLVWDGQSSTANSIKMRKIKGEIIIQ